MYSLYCHTNPFNDKKYFGISSKPTSRWKGGSGYKSNEDFWGAIKAIGWDSFKHEILAEDMTLEEAKALEALYIVRYKTEDTRYGYNQTKYMQDPAMVEAARTFIFPDQAEKMKVEAQEMEELRLYLVQMKQERELTYAQMSELLGVSANTLCSFMTGNKNFGSPTVAKIQAVLDTLQDMVDEANEAAQEATTCPVFIDWMNSRINVTGAFLEAAGRVNTSEYNTMCAIRAAHPMFNLLRVEG